MSRSGRRSPPRHPGSRRGVRRALARVRSGLPPRPFERAKRSSACWSTDRLPSRCSGTGSGVAFVQASLRRSMSGSLDTDGRSLVEAIENADDEEAAVAAVRELPSGVCALVAGGADATKVGRVVGSAIDALTRRLLASAIDELGEPPVPWAWLALGSEARLEQALHTDQDHALAYDPGDRTVEELDPYFASLAEHVTAGLERAGIPRCDGDAMAVHPGLRRPIDGWGDAIRGWMSIRASTAASCLRSCSTSGAWTVRSTPSRSSMPWSSTAPTAYPQFVRHLTGRALERKPPTGFRKNLVVESKGEHAGRLDIKHGGVTIVGNIARVYAIAGGHPQKGTLGPAQGRRSGRPHRRGSPAGAGRGVPAPLADPPRAPGRSGRAGRGPGRFRGPGDPRPDRPARIEGGVHDRDERAGRCWRPNPTCASSRLGQTVRASHRRGSSSSAATASRRPSPTSARASPRR